MRRRRRQGASADDRHGGDNNCVVTSIARRPSRCLARQLATVLAASCYGMAAGAHVTFVEGDCGLFGATVMSFGMKAVGDRLSFNGLLRRFDGPSKLARLGKSVCHGLLAGLARYRLSVLPRLHQAPVF